MLSSESTIEPTPTTSRTGELAKRLKYMKDKLGFVMEETRPLVPGPKLDSCLVHQLHKRVEMALTGVMGVSREILAWKKGGEDLLVQASKLEKTALDLGLRIERLSYRPDESSPKPTVSSGVKLPKIDVPTFKGNIMDWQSFWEQFDGSVHSRSQLTDPQRLAYLCQALKDGPAKRVIEGLSGSVEFFFGTTLDLVSATKYFLHECACTDEAKCAHPRVSGATISLRSLIVYIEDLRQQT